MFTGAYGTTGIRADRVRITINAHSGGGDGLYIKEWDIYGVDLPLPPAGTLIKIR